MNNDSKHSSTTLRSEQMKNDSKHSSTTLRSEQMKNDSKHPSTTLRSEQMNNDSKHSSTTLRSEQMKNDSKHPSTTLRVNDYIELGFAKYDLKREKIKGFPEVVLALGKDEKHLIAIIEKALKKTKKLLITKINPEQFKSIKKRFSKKSDKIKFFETARLIYFGEKPKDSYGKIAVVCAGTADVPVAEEAAYCCEIFGSRVERLYDVGVAGIHRLLSNVNVFEGCNCVITVAGMDGALPSVVGGLVSCPLIAVPTSVGYGASFKGLSALLTMLNTCSVGVSVVNIDNGFGAAYQAHLINKMVERK